MMMTEIVEAPKLNEEELANKITEELLAQLVTQSFIIPKRLEPAVPHGPVEENLDVFLIDQSNNERE